MTEREGELEREEQMLGPDLLEGRKATPKRETNTKRWEVGRMVRQRDRDRKGTMVNFLTRMESLKEEREEGRNGREEECDTSQTEQALEANYDHEITTMIRDTQMGGPKSGSRKEPGGQNRGKARGRKERGEN